MAIEKKSDKERDFWTELADMWYIKASMASPHLGRLLHHRAILARSQGTFTILWFLSRSVMSVQPFKLARLSIEMLVVNPNSKVTLPPPTAHLERRVTDRDLPQRFTMPLIRILAMDFKREISRQGGMYDTAAELVYENLSRFINKAQHRYATLGETIAHSLMASLFGWFDSDEQNRPIGLRPLYSQSSKVTRQEVASIKQVILRPWCTALKIFTLHLQITDDEFVLSLVHVFMAFITILASRRGGDVMLVGDPFVPWKNIAAFCNEWSERRQLSLNSPIIDTVALVHGDTDPTIPAVLKCLPEDRGVRGLCWSVGYPSDNLFANLPQPEEEMPNARGTFNPIHTRFRVERILWLALKLAKFGEQMRARGGFPGSWLGTVETTQGRKFAVVHLDSLDGATGPEPDLSIAKASANGHEAMREDGD